MSTHILPWIAVCVISISWLWLVTFFIGLSGDSCHDYNQEILMAMSMNYYEWPMSISDTANKLCSKDLQNKRRLFLISCNERVGRIDITSQLYSGMIHGLRFRSDSPSLTTTVHIYSLFRNTFGRKFPTWSNKKGSLATNIVYSKAPATILTTALGKCLFNLNYKWVYDISLKE